MTTSPQKPLRVGVGLLLAAHGAHKLTTLFGGDGPGHTAQEFEEMGLRPGLPAAWTAGVAQVGGGLLFASGRGVGPAAVVLNGTLLTAIQVALRPHGFWSRDGGFEYPLVLVALISSISAETHRTRRASDPGSFLTGPAPRALGELGAALLGTAIVVRASQQQPSLPG